jgi:hypothetical protein
MRLWIFQSVGGGIGQWLEVGVVVGGVRGLRFLVAVPAVVVLVVPLVVVNMVATALVTATAIADSVVLVVLVVHDDSRNP